MLEADAERGGYTAVVPGLPDCIVRGRSVAECVARADEAIVGYLARREVTSLALRAMPEPQ
jgi:predicted RNase H-like HicB family nuclease